MSEIKSEKSMRSTAFVQHAMQDHIAPPSFGSVKARIRYCARVLQWTYSRTKDAWYGDPRISISADELRVVENKSGLRYAQEELRTTDELIARATALLDGPNSDFYRPFVDAFRAMARALDRTGNRG